MRRQVTRIRGNRPALEDWKGRCGSSCAVVLAGRPPMAKTEVPLHGSHGGNQRGNPVGRVLDYSRSASPAADLNPRRRSWVSTQEGDYR